MVVVGVGVGSVNTNTMITRQSKTGSLQSKTIGGEIRLANGVGESGLWVPCDCCASQPRWLQSSTVRPTRGPSETCEPVGRSSGRLNQQQAKVPSCRCCCCCNDECANALCGCAITTTQFFTNCLLHYSNLHETFWSLVGR